jgi:hypothetical protein
MYRKCPYCGATLDPGEKCDCNENAAPDVEDPEAAQMKTINDNLTDPNNFVNKGVYTNGYCKT